MIKIDKVKLLKRHLKNYEYITRTDDKYEDGIFVPGVEVKEKFKAVDFPVDANTLKLYPEGTVNSDDRLLYTKKLLNNTNSTINRLSDSTEFRIFDKVDYLSLADLKVYLVKRVDSNG